MTENENLHPVIHNDAVNISVNKFLVLANVLNNCFKVSDQVENENANEKDTDVEEGEFLEADIAIQATCPK